MVATDVLTTDSVFKYDKTLEMVAVEVTAVVVSVLSLAIILAMVATDVDTALTV